MSTLYKYPRTPHLPFSEGATSDDRILTSTEHLKPLIVVVTEKFDGENTTIYNDHYHARSLDSKHHEYHSYLLSHILPSLQYQIPANWRICGEYLYAKHSIGYTDLPDYFLVFSIWDENNRCLSWQETKEYCELLGLHYVTELYTGPYDEDTIKKIAEETVQRGGEGVVVRDAEGFDYTDFQEHMAKYVRKNHVQTDKHWSLQSIEKNLLKD